ncbi:hypothetical protein [Clostridium tyrobutyricum]|uniref:hypothetical protein n=1 Tax=Clostridium tyrobutyricum TaxID=1519 RepID=UPI00057D7DD1|nr:hypothetical protein [Clostridium tyrobutyricum]
MDKFIKGQIISYCQFVKCGKPAAMMALQDRYVEEAKNLIDNQFNLSVHIENLSEGWKTMWIYKEKYVLEIILELPKQPKTIFDHWVLGKVFGYSEQSIKDYLEINQLL